jgi:hypothetical protein
MTHYLETGSASTPIRGRGKRNVKKNSKYTDEGEMSDNCEELSSPVLVS